MCVCGDGDRGEEKREKRREETEENFKLKVVELVDARRILRLLCVCVVVWVFVLLCVCVFFELCMLI